MLEIVKNEMYLEDLDYAAGILLPWEKLNGKKILLSGATGLIGSFLSHVLLMHHCKVFALGRNAQKATTLRQLFPEDFMFIPHDINNAIDLDETIDYVIHLASNTHPIAYATDPIGTITTNIIGTKNMLDFAVAHKAERFIFASSNEVYGENRADVEYFTEAYCGYIDCNTMRAGYPEAKRCGEALCQAYHKQHGLNIVIPRLTRTYGPTMLSTDTKAIAQFIRNGVENKDIVLKSKGLQDYSYTYVMDAVTGLLTVMLKGQDGEAYNIADKSSDATLLKLTQIIAEETGRKVVFQIPDEVEKSGYSTATKAKLDSAKLKTLGWQAKYDIKQGLTRTIAILKAAQE